MEIDKDLTVDFVKRSAISSVVILEEPRIPEGSFSNSLRAKVQYNDTNKSIAIWEMNKKSKNLLIDKFGTDTIKMVGQKIPILIDEYQRNKFTISINSRELMQEQESVA